MKYHPFITVSLIYLLSACNQPTTVTREADYNAFLNASQTNNKLERVNQEIAFWENRLKADSSSYVNKLELSKYLLKQFDTNGDISALKKGDSLLLASSQKINHIVPEISFALTQNSIKEHQFKNAKEYLTKAENMHGDRFTAAMLQFDISMELGNDYNAYKALNKINNNSFDYLIRKAKWEDHSGNLDAAIATMEKAFEKIKNKNLSLYCWTLSNLADMYGHANQLDKAYNSYLEVLKKDSTNLYSLKGIARIAWINDNKPAEAKRIINFILSQNNMPDLYLLLGEIYYSEGNKEDGDKQIEKFLKVAATPAYGNMYNKSLIMLNAEHLGNIKQSILLAEQEVAERPTPETYSWLSYVYCKQGRLNKALAISQDYVINKTHEPEALMYTAFVYSANGKREIAKKLLLECKESKYELGPIAMEEIDNKLKRM